MKTAAASWPEVVCCLATVPASASSVVSLLHWQGQAGPSRSKQAALELLLVCLPPVLVVCTPATAVVTAVSMSSCLIQLAAHLSSCSSHSTESTAAVLRELHAVKPRFVSWFRGGVMLWTCLCILAVDFSSYHRRFSKSRTFGIGIMDVGVGSFVFSSALVHKGASKSKLQPFGPLLCLGGVRLLATTATGYHVDMEEYGEHWNFFFTLAALALLSALTPRLSTHTSGIVGCIVLGGQQLYLSLGGIEAAHSSARGPSLWSRNKEGLISLPGFCALSLMSRSLATWLTSCIRRAAAASLAHSNDQAVPRRVLLPLAARAMAVATILWLAAWQVDARVQPVSRRTCNASYIVWSLALNYSMLLAFACVAAQDAMLLAGRSGGSQSEAEAHSPSIWHSTGPLPILHALSDHMLGSFLLANVLTGACNHAIDTKACNKLLSLMIISLYVLILTCSSLSLSAKGCQIPMQNLKDAA